MDERQIRELVRQYSSFTEPPRRRRNILQALAILLVVAILSGAVSTFIFLYIEQSTTPPQQQTIIVQKRERTITYPQTRVEVADRFGGNPMDWSQNIWNKSWVYTSDTPIEIPCGPNVSVYSDHLTLYWKV